MPESPYDRISGVMTVLRTLWGAILRYSTPVLWLLIGVFLLQRSDLEPGDRVEQVRAFTRPMEFDYLSWTWDAMWIKVAQIGLGAVDYVPVAQQPQIVLDYLDLVRQIHQVEWEIGEIYADPSISTPEVASKELRDNLDALGISRTTIAPMAEAIFQNQLSTIIGDLGLTFGGQPLPPVLYHVTPLPRALIVSPRDVIRQDANISLVPEITVAQRETLEYQVDQALNVSSLVVNIGGVGLYPTMVMETTNINWLAEVVSHEWVHNFLTLRPLGASYMASPELRIINETVANLAEKEIGIALIERYYPQFAPPPVSSAEGKSEDLEPQDPPPFDFRTEMHTTRVMADMLLAEGKVEEAETYMESRRLFFWENGYHIRKINQAYFAFYGAYADQPGGAAGAAEDPIGGAVRKLRSQSASLAEFLNRISWMWSYEQLLAAVMED